MAAFFFLTILGQDISVKKLCFGLSASVRCLPVTSDQPILLLHQPSEQAAQPGWYCQGFSSMCVKMEQLEILLQVFFGSGFDVTWFVLMNVKSDPEAWCISYFWMALFQQCSEIPKRIKQPSCLAIYKQKKPFFEVLTFKQIIMQKICRTLFAVMV